jgi:hypothetical protein
MKSLRFAAVAIALAASATLLPGRVQAQTGGDGPHINILADGPSKTPDELEAEQQRNQAYKESLRKIPDAKGSNDPWGGVRTADAPKTVQSKTVPAKTAASAKPKSKTTSSPN